jgi:endoglucanase
MRDTLELTGLRTFAFRFLGMIAVTFAGAVSCSSDDGSAHPSDSSNSMPPRRSGPAPTEREASTKPPPAPDVPVDAGAIAPPDAEADAHPAVQPEAGPPDVVVRRTSYDPNDFLKVDGTRIKNARGELVSLYGTNLGGWFVHESWMSPLAGVPDDSHMISTLTQRFGAANAQMLIDTYLDAWIQADDFPRIAAEGLNVVRIPIYYLNVMDTSGNWKLDSAGNIDFSRMDWAIREAARNGLYSIPDLHGVPGSQNGWDHSGLLTSTPTFFTDTNAQAIALKFLTELARHYAGNSFVAAYDLLNEPNAATGETLWSFYDKAVAAVRAVDPNHIVVLETPWQWSGLPSPSTRNWTNVIYSNHNYQWTNNNDITVMRAFVDGILNDATAHFPTYNVPLIIGEFTLFGLMDAWTYGLNRFAEQAGINWTMWTYKVRTSNSSWGLYNLNTGETASTNVPNVMTDTQDAISTKWSAWKTSEHFQRNNALSDIVKAAAQRNLNLRRPVFVNVP